MKFMRLACAALAAILVLSACGPKADKAKLQAAEAAYHQGNYQAAVEAFQALAEQGNARAQFFLGEMYLDGRGVARDFAQALRWASAAAEQQSTDAQFTLGGMYESGKGVPQDVVQAHMWYSLAATSGDEAAIRRKAELEVRKMTAPQIERSKQLELAWLAAHRH